MAGMSQNEMYATWVMLGIIGYGVFHLSSQIEHVRKRLEELHSRPDPRSTPVEYEY